jgi:hypothetical protein
MSPHSINQRWYFLGLYHMHFVAHRALCARLGVIDFVQS